MEDWGVSLEHAKLQKPIGYPRWGVLHRQMRSGTQGGWGRIGWKILLLKLWQHLEVGDIYLTVQERKGLPRWPNGKNLPANAGDTRHSGSIPGLGRSPEESMATPSSILAWKTL